MADLLVDLASYLDANLAITSGTDLRIADLAQSPDDMTVLYEYGGQGPTQVFGDNDKPAVIKPRVQVIGRGGGTPDHAYTAARQRVRDVYNLLTLVANETVNGVVYFRAEPLQEPFFFQRDEANRILFACNFDVWRVAE